MSDLSHVTNFVAIDDHLCTAGQPSADQIADIGVAEYKVVINLATSDSDSWLLNEGDLVAQHGMQYVHVPVVWDDPQKSDFELFVEVMNAHAEDRIFVHCAMNMRASAFVFMYRVIHHHVDPLEAKMAMQQIWDLHGVWEELVEEILGDHGVDYFDIG